MGEENDQIVIIFIVSAGIIVFLAVLLIFFLIIYQKRVVTQENRLQKLENEKQQILLKAAIQGQERERQRLAKDLHDGIGSLLSGLSLNLKFQKNKQTPDSEQAKFLAEACSLVENGIKNVRAVSHNLMPATLESFGLVSAINECVDPIRQSNKGFSIEVDIQNEPYRASKEIELGLLRVFQELLQNSIKHSEASIIQILLIFYKDRIQLDYTDNGKGCKIEEVESNGIGFKNIQSRIQALDGKIDFKNPKKEGFFTSVEIPIL